MIEHDVKVALERLVAREKSYNRYADYYDGDQALLFATDKFKTVFGRAFGGFSDNLCPVVVDALADRLQLTGFGIDEDVSPDDQDRIQEMIEEIWEYNRMDRRQGEVHQEAFISGDAYVTVWPSKKDPSMPTIYMNRAKSMTIQYDEDNPGDLLWAAKCWAMTDKRIRLTMYYPDRVERYATPQPVQGAGTLKPESFAPYAEDGSPDVVPNPYGRVPVFHFANNAATGSFGRSELRSVVPLQDALNKSITDMLVAMEFVALPQRWVTGIELEQDPVTGQLKWPFKAGVDRIWASESVDTKFGEFPSANLSSFIQVQDGFRTEVARVSRTPQHYFMLDATHYPSGESLKTAESPFTAKARDRAVAFGNTWEDVASFALKVASVTAEAVDLAAEWKDPAPRSLKEYAEFLTICQGLTPPMLRRLDFSEDEIEEIIGGAKSVGDAILDAFNNGIGTGLRAGQSTTPAKAPPAPPAGPGAPGASLTGQPPASGGAAG